MRVYKVVHGHYEGVYDEWFFTDREDADLFYIENLDDKIPEEKEWNDRKTYRRTELVGEPGDQRLKHSSLRGEYLTLRPVKVNESFSGDEAGFRVEIDIEGERYADSIDEVGS